jgi:hypothetical protein
MKMWDGKKLVRVQKTGTKKKPGVEYVLLDETGDKEPGRLFIGYETLGFRNKAYVNVVRWVPGVVR